MAEEDWTAAMSGAAMANPWVAGAAALYSGITGSRSAKKQRKAMEAAQRQARIDLAKSLAEAKQQLGPYSEIGTRDGLYKLASLMGDDRFGSQEAMELYELESKYPELGEIYPLVDAPEETSSLDKLKPGHIFHDGYNPYSAVATNLYNDVASQSNTQTQGTYDSELAAYLKRKADLEAAIAKQKAEGTYRKAGFDYITETEAYKNRLNEGQRNMLRGMSANRGVLGGGALKDLEKYGQDYASNEYNQEFTRLAHLAGLGQQANTAIANAAMGQGTNLANLSLAGGTTLADYYNNQNNVTQGTLENALTISERRRRSSYNPNTVTIGGG